MVDPSSLTYKQKILIYLKDYYQQHDDSEERSEDVTQKGISKELGISRTHVSRVLGELSEKGLIKEKLSSVKGHNRKLKTYSLTTNGFRKVNELLDELSDTPVTIVEGGEEKTVPITSVEEKTDKEIDILRCISLLDSSEDSKINLDEQCVFEPIKMVGGAPEIDEIYDRETEIEHMKDWLESKKSVLAVLGRKGRGASTLTSKFVTDVKNRHVLWISLEGSTEETIKEDISNFLEKLGVDESSFKALKNQMALIVFDNYYEVDSEVVSSLKELSKMVEKDDPLKVIVTGRVGTPVYERFYQPEDVEDGVVQELEVPPLGKDGAQKMLGNEIKDDALKRIMMFTKGSPLLLKLLRDDKKEELCELTPWEEEQISLLMYLKTETEDDAK